MNLFRSEEHVRNWSGFKPETEAGILSLADAIAIMSTPRHRDRLSGHYVSTAPELAPQFLERLLDVSPFAKGAAKGLVPQPLVDRGGEAPASERIGDLNLDCRGTCHHGRIPRHSPGR